MVKMLHKAAAIIVEDESLLVLRSHTKETFFAPGGKLEEEENSRQALIRELREEISIEVVESEISFFATFTAPAAGAEEMTLCMDVFVVHSYQGLITPQSEIAECCWINSANVGGISIGSIFRDQVYPRLLANGMIR